jgi:RND family efflux transporter MFP subunit
MANMAAQRATVASQTANVHRLEQLQSFEKVYAPFDGVITARNIDTGALVDSGSGAKELFHIVEKDKLRVYVEVPQNYTQRLSEGMTADLHFAEYPGKVYQARLTTDSNALDPATRTLRVEFTVDNAKEELLPGGYTEVHIKVAAQGDGMRLPVNTLMYHGDGVFVAVADAQNKARLKKVTLGRDFGTEVEVTAGLNADEQVIVNPPDSLADGADVRIATPPPAAEKDAKAAPAAGDKKP